MPPGMSSSHGGAMRCLVAARHRLVSCLGRCKAASILCWPSTRLPLHAHSGSRVSDRAKCRFEVDVYNSGHVHDYSSTWPICYDVANKTSDVCRGSDGKPIHSFVNPKGTVHVTEG